MLCTSFTREESNLRRDPSYYYSRVRGNPDPKLPNLSSSNLQRFKKLLSDLPHMEPTSVGPVDMELVSPGTNLVDAGTCPVEAKTNLTEAEIRHS